MKSDLFSFVARLRALMNDPQVESRFNFGELALELFALQFEANPAYRTICEARPATPLTVSNWTQIPAVPTAAFKEFELSCIPAGQRTQIFHSSGTTRQSPSHHFHNAKSLAVYEDSLWHWFSRQVATPAHGFSLLLLTPSPADAPHSSLVHMIEFVRQRLAAGAVEFSGSVGPDGGWELNPASVIAQLEKAQASSKPVLMLGTAFTFVHLLDHLVRTGLQFRLPAGSRVMETGGYKGRSRQIPKTELHQLITRFLGVTAHNVICEYGMSELSSQAYDDPTVAPRTFRFPPWAQAQIISPETGREVAAGETGLIRVFDLANVFSVLAVQSEDLGVRRGAGFELLGRASLAEPRGCSLLTI